MNILNVNNTAGGCYDVSPTVLLTSQLPHGLTQSVECIRNDIELGPQHGNKCFIARGVRLSLFGVLGVPRAAGGQELDHRV
jgi:hypothetical protein